MDSLLRENLTFVLFDAEDGFDAVDMQYVSRYAAKEKRQTLLKTASMSKPELLERYNTYKQGGLTDAERTQIHHRLHFGCYVSHVRLWLKLISEHMQFMVILEDDAIVVSGFESKLTSLLRKLPNDWDLLFLNACYHKVGEFVRTGLRQYRGGSCTIGYVISLKAAFHLSHIKATKSNKPIDHMMTDDVWLGHMKAFLADPPLVDFGGSDVSTMAY